MNEVTIGLALSGGGSRAIAFHLGCLRALQEKGILNRVRVLSSVSGGSVIAALYAYKDQPFRDFENEVRAILRKGLTRGIVKTTFFSAETPRILVAIVTSGSLALLGRCVAWLVTILGLVGISNATLDKAVAAFQAPLPRFASRTTAFVRYLREAYFGTKYVSDVARGGLEVVINATELRTGTAFRYGTRESGSWRFGTLVEPVQVAKAVAASAAFPALLPAMDETQRFLKGGSTTAHRTIVTDGGVYDNLGISCLLPGRDPSFGMRITEVDFIICCAAGQGLPDASDIPYLWSSRMSATVSTIHRRTHSMSFDLLHRLARSGGIKGFLLPYLGQQDEKLPSKPISLVPRDETFNYPTDFSPMKDDDIQKLSLRGEQLTRSLLETYHPNL